MHSSSEPNVVEVRGVRKVYMDGKFVALDGVDLDVKKEEFLVIMGRSGSGKSTLLHLIGCLDTPTSGTIRIGGVETGKMINGELALIRRRKIGFIFQTFNLVPNLTAQQNVALPLLFDNVPKAEREEKAAKMLDSVGLALKYGNYPNEMSGGERQRVAIARALINDPEIIVGDEPTGNLDSASAKQVLEIMNDLHDKKKKTVVLVTHEQYVADLGERVIYMRDGKITDEKIAGKIK
jgi:putative ABC transport system ATP-binding protein